MLNGARMRTSLWLASCLSLTACGLAPAAVDESTQAVTRWEWVAGEEQQGTMLLGEAGDTERGVRPGGALGDSLLSGLHVERGELYGWRTDSGSATPVLVHGEQLINAELSVETATGSIEVLVGGARKADRAELGGPVPDPTGQTWIYDLYTKSKKPFCKPDRFGRVDAIPVAARWDDAGDRLETSSADPRFTFACVSGVVAKCYQWGFRPWESRELRDLHQSCTRAARADYCGDGTPHTCAGTPINIFDADGYIPRYSLDGFFFEAGWGPNGARCLSKNRWDTLPASMLCTDFARTRRGPYDKVGKPQECDTVETVLATYPDAHVFTESQLHPWPLTCSSLLLPH